MLWGGVWTEFRIASCLLFMFYSRSADLYIFVWFVYAVNDWFFIDQQYRIYVGSVQCPYAYIGCKYPS